jgi:hypothetical protein
MNQETKHPGILLFQQKDSLSQRGGAHRVALGKGGSVFYLEQSKI